ncbi:MAG: hypothetical protein ACYS19_11670 [Planctomycetota bacterium]
MGGNIYEKTSHARSEGLRIKDLTLVELGLLPPAASGDLAAVMVRAEQ